MPVSWQDIPGWYAFDSVYQQMVDEAPRGGGVYVEVGVAFGRSVASLSRKFIDAGKHAKIWAIDPFWDDWWTVPESYPTHLERPTWGGEHAQFGRDLGGPFSAFVHCMRTHAPEELERINVCRCRSADAATFIGRCNGVLIDADHSYEAVAQDIALWRPHMMPGGILAGDDFHEGDFPGVVRACNDAFGPKGYEVRGTTWVVRT